MARRCVANLDVIATVPKASLKERITTLSPDKLQIVDAAIHFALGLEE